MKIFDQMLLFLHCFAFIYFLNHDKNLSPYFFLCLASINILFWCFKEVFSNLILLSMLYYDLHNLFRYGGRTMKPDILYRILIWERRKTNKATLILFPVALTGGYNFPITSRDNCVLIYLTKTTHTCGKILKNVEYIN